jgi:hypothetical protein
MEALFGSCLLKYDWDIRACITSGKILELETFSHF